MKRLSSLVLTSLLLGSCMPPISRRVAFSSRYSTNATDTVTQVFERLPSQATQVALANNLGRPLVVAVKQGEKRALVVQDVEQGRELWSKELQITSAPELLGDLVVVATGTELHAYDLASGVEKWSFRGQIPFMGAARERDTLVAVFSVGNSGGSNRHGLVVALDAEAGNVRWEHEVIGVLGRPTVRAGYAFVPWNKQSISALELETGVEHARVQPPDAALWVFSSDQGVFYGNDGAYRWTATSASSGADPSNYISNPVPEVPGDPPLYRDGYAPASGGRSARDKIRFAFRPALAEGEKLAFEHDTLFLAYYRFVLAMNPRTGEFRWVRSIDPEDSFGSTGASPGPMTDHSRFDIEAVQVTSKGLFVYCSDGNLRFLDPQTGAITGQKQVGANLGAVVLDLEGLELRGEGARPAPEGSARDQLVGLIRDPDNRLVPIREFLVHQLGALPEAEATRDLLELYRLQSLPVTLRRTVADALRGRRNGAEHLLHALEGEHAHYNFLENRQAPPLDLIAPTLASMGAREAVPVLLQHLLDHETPIAYLPPIIEAVVALGDASSIPELHDFLQRYRRDGAFAGDNVVALEAAAMGLFRLGDLGTRQWLAGLGQDAGTHAALRGRIAQLFEDERGGAQRGSEEQQLAEAQENLTGRLNALRAAVEAFPRRLTTDGFEAEWANHLDGLRECAAGLITRRPGVSAIRINVTVRSEPPMDLFQTTPPRGQLGDTPSFQQKMEAIAGQLDWVERQLNRLESFQSSVRAVSYSPQDPELRQCMDPIVSPMKFPGFGRAPSNLSFQEQISTVRTQEAVSYTLGFGSPAGAEYTVPWFLVSSPSLDTRTGQLQGGGPVVASGSTSSGGSDAGASRDAASTSWATGGEQDAGTSSNGSSSTGSQGDAGRQGTTGSGRQWWEQ